MRILYSVFLILLTIPLAAQVSATPQQNKIHGTWYHHSSNEEFTLILRPDGSGELDDEVIKYKIEKNTIVMTATENNEILVYKFTLHENSLTISGGDLETPIAFVRKDVQKEK
jgi:hypothetical protein